MAFGIALIVSGLFIAIFAIVRRSRSNDEHDILLSVLFGMLAWFCMMMGVILYFDSDTPAKGKITCSEYIVDHIQTETINHKGDTIVTNQYVIQYR